MVHPQFLALKMAFPPYQQSPFWAGRFLGPPLIGLPLNKIHFKLINNEKIDWKKKITAENFSLDMLMMTGFPSGNSSKSQTALKL